MMNKLILIAAVCTISVVNSLSTRPFHLFDISRSISYDKEIFDDASSEPVYSPNPELRRYNNKQNPENVYILNRNSERADNAAPLRPRVDDANIRPASFDSPSANANTQKEDNGHFFAHNVNVASLKPNSGSSQSNNQPGKPTNFSTNQGNQAGNIPENQTGNQPGSFSINQAGNQPNNQPIIFPVNQPNIPLNIPLPQLGFKPPNIPVNQDAIQGNPGNFPINQLENQPGNFPVAPAGNFPVYPPMRQPNEPSNVSIAITNFGINLLKNTLQEGNLVVSPYSVATVMALLQQGSLGETQQQISRALQMSPEMAASSFGNLISRTKRRFSKNVVKTANNIFIADAFELNPAFRNVVSRDFGSEITPINFSKSRQAVRKINQWVGEKTDFNIKDFVNENNVNKNLQILLANVVYFKGLWMDKFKRELTQPGEFRLSNGENKVTLFMLMRRMFKGGIDSTNGAKVLILPFDGEQYSLVLILPRQGSSAADVLSSLTVRQLMSYQDFLPTEVRVEIPKFTIKADTDLIPVLHRMGVSNIFSQNSELSGVGMYRSYSPQVSSALHTAVLAIDEEGGTAAAATSFAAIALSFDDTSMTFKANKPFLSVIWDNELALPLFMGKIEDPSS